MKIMKEPINLTPDILVPKMTTDEMIHTRECPYCAAPRDKLRIITWDTAERLVCLECSRVIG